MFRSFRGGIHPEENKITAACPIERVQAASFVTLPLSQHIGAPAIPRVKVGDAVLRGETIATAAEGLSCPVHASVSGVVRAIESVPLPGGEGMAIVIENDFKEELSPEVMPFPKPLNQASPEELEDFIKSKGIVGMGGAAFPTDMKIKSARGKVKTLVVNGAECEPYLTGDHRLFLEQPQEIIGGVKILLRATGADRAIIAVEDNKKDAARALDRILPPDSEISLKILKTKYPQGDERQLVKALLGGEIPRGKFPSDVGVVIFNVETCWSVYRAFVFGYPVMEKVVTVSGNCVKTPGNLLVPLGIRFEEAIRRCGGFSRKPDKILSGGPMMGQAQWTAEVPVTKGVGGILALWEPVEKTGVCIHCGRCVGRCPMHLVPLEFVRLVQQEDWEEAERYSILSCSECGCCTFTCPAKIPILQSIRVGKEVIRAKNKKS